MRFKTFLRPYRKRVQWAIIRLLIKTFRPEGIVIVGCGRSGTRFSSKYLTQHGLRVGHENLRYNGISSWFLTASEGKVPTGPEFKLISDLGFTIIHQVREPLSSISSMQTLLDSNWHFIAKHIPLDPESDSKVLMAMKYYYYWNKLAQKLTDKLVHVEHFQREITPYIKRKLKSPGKEKAVSGKDRVNTREYKSLGWEDLEREDPELTRKIRELAASYNYT